MMAKLKLPFVALCLVVAIVFPLVYSNPTYTQIAFYTLAFAAAGSAWNIFSGYTGYIALGHAAFFGLGSYTIAKLCVLFNTPGGWKPFWFVPVAGLVAAIFAVPLGLIALRTRRHTFVVITIAIFFIFQLLAENNVFQITGGEAGVSLPIPLAWGPVFYNLPFYYLTLLILVVALLTSWWIRNSKYGLELLAIRDDEERARGLGVRTGPTKLGAFVLSAFFVGMIGAMMAYFIESTYPQFAFDATFDVTVALMAFLGGLGTLAGPVVGALLIIPAQQILTLNGGASSTSLILFGALFLIVLLLLPQGIVPTLGALWNKLRRRLWPSDLPTPIVPDPAEGTARQSAIVLEN